MEKKKIIIDTDIGDDIDDAYAIALAMASSEVEILGVTTVYKNVEQRAYITKALLTAGGFERVPVYAGANNPLKEPPSKFPYETVGENGLVNLRHFINGMQEYDYEKGSAIHFILDSADKYPNEITLVAIGPLTNLAIAYQTRPSSFKKLKDIVCMGGFFNSYYKEWNVMCDPEAARIVYGCEVPIKIVGANCTLQTEVFEEDLKKIRALKGAAGKLLNDMLSLWFNDNSRNCVMHDGLAMSVLYANYVKFEKQNIYVPLEESMRGYTLKVNHKEKLAQPVEVSVAVDHTAFLNDMLIRLSKLN